MAGPSPRYEYYPDLPEWTPDLAAEFAELRARLDASLALNRTLELALLLETFHHAFGRVTPLNGLTLEYNGQTHQAVFALPNFVRDLTVSARRETAHIKQAANAA